MARRRYSLKLYPAYYKKHAKLGETMVETKNLEEYKAVKKYNQKQFEKYR